MGKATLKEVELLTAEINNVFIKISNIKERVNALPEEHRKEINGKVVRLFDVVEAMKS